MITEAQHEDLKNALCSLNARLVELDDRVRDGGLASLQQAGRALEQRQIVPTDDDMRS